MMFTACLGHYIGTRLETFSKISTELWIQTVYPAITISHLYRYVSLLGTDIGKVRHDACIFTGQRR